MSDQDFAEFIAGLGEDTRLHVAKKIAEAVAPLEKRIAELESRPHGIKYAGPWTAGTVYDQGDCVSRKGLWIATCATRQKPGESADWRLAVKEGRDGRDGKDLRNGS